ncbi:D-glycero-alpha-D-manno-heptose-1,7-bisphosphate 7-phosphatase [Chloroflexota bacterium]
MFLDRDGTINVDTHFPYQIEYLELVPKAVDGLRLLATLPFHLIVVANQAGIALGKFTREQMSEFNKELYLRAEHAGARIDGFYYCPHLETKHMQPGDPSCQCSKPAPGMLIEAAKDFQLDLTRSFLIGDKLTDIAAGQSAGCVSILVKTGAGGEEEVAPSVVPHYVTENLYEAALVIHSHTKS